MHFQMDELLFGWMNEQMSGWMGEWVDGWMTGLKVAINPLI